MRLLSIALVVLLLTLSLGCASWLSTGGGGEPIPSPQGPAATLPNSLHGTAGGMQWWYEQLDGAGALFGVAYADTGCGNCHTDSCTDCHVDAGGGAVDEPAACKVCHGRLAKEEVLGVTDLHFSAGMTCSDCHSAHEAHGGEDTYNSMLEAGAMTAACENCHGAGTSAADVPDTAPHTVHTNLSCDACHMAAAVTCYNCHFETLLDSHEKKAAGAFKDFILLLNDDDDSVRAGTYQSVYYDGKGFVAFGPFHGHSVTAEGRNCVDCHSNERIQELNDTDAIVMSWWDEGEGKIMHTTGVVPFVPDMFEFQFLDFDGSVWSPVTPTEIGLQNEFCTPLTQAQLEALGYGEAVTGPAATLPTSLHGTAGGMQWWYEQPDGAGALFGVDYADTGCGSCHTDSCDDCHAEAGGGAVNEPEACMACHGRIGKEAQLGVTDLHFEMGMACSDCHSAHEAHGGEDTYDSMLSPGAMDTVCENCHAKGASASDVPDTQPHTVHINVSCDACHMAAAVTCYNCHFETLLDSHEKKAAAAFKDFILLLNDDNGNVRAGTYQSVYYDGKGFVAFGPFHGHSVTADGRDCVDCHSNDRIAELNDTGKIVMSWWDAGESKVMHTTGVVPFLPDMFEFQFLDFDGSAWSPVTPTETGLQHKFCSPLTADQLAALGFTGGYSYLGVSSCTGCHAAEVAEWENTGHAVIEENIQAGGMGDIESCRACHDTGYGDGGFEDYVTTPQFANVQCESCHGTGVGHPANGALPASLDAALCGACHTDAHHPTYDEWQASAHGMVDVTSHEATGDNCVRCHTGDWFVEIMINGGDPPAEDLDPAVNPGMPIVCAACHDPHDSAVEHQLRVSSAGDVLLAFMDTPVSAGKGNLCVVCHDGRCTVSDRDSHITDGSGHFGPHANAQGPMFFGVSAVEFDGAYTSNHGHQFTPDTCITCHMQAKDFEDPVPAVTGHEFAVKYEACIACHTDVPTAAALAAALEAEIQALLDEFVATWPAAWKDVTDPDDPVLYNRPEISDPPDPETDHAGPPVDDVDGDQYRQALWNYLLIIDDGSLGIHNPVYARQCLQAAVDKLHELTGT